MRFCTVVARNYLAFARVLGRSVQALGDGSRLTVLLLDDIDGEVSAADEPFDILAPHDLDIASGEFHNMALIYDVLELATAVKPWLLSRILVDHDVACYLDPDIEVFGSMAPVEELARRHGIVLTPHSITPLPRDGLLPSEETIRLAGVFNLGFIAVSRDARAFLTWWCERLRRECRVEIDAGLFVDQRWIDFVPSYFEHTVLHDEGYNVAYWNLFERNVKLGSDGYEVNGRPLRFFHFSGFDPLLPYRLSKYQAGEERIKLDEHYVVAYLCTRYAAQLLDAGHLEAQGTAYHYGYTANGVSLDARARQVCRETLEAAEKADASDRNALSEASDSAPDPFDPATADAFVRWLTGPGPDPSAPSISRYVRAFYDLRPEIAVQFPDLAGYNGVQLLEWVRRRGRTHANLLPESVPPPLARPRGSATDLPEGVNVVGYLYAEDGVGEVARSAIDVLDRLGSEVSLWPCFATSSRQSAKLSGGARARDVTFDTTITCVNADQLPMLDEAMGGGLPVSATTVGIWAWEVERFPQWMARSCALVDEVWTYSRHARDAIAAACTIPVHVFSPPVAVSDETDVDRDSVGFSDDFTFLFCFAFSSGFERKNPLGVIEAFRRAFAPGEGPRLVIKSVQGPAHPIPWARLRAAAEDRSDIEVRDGYEPAPRQRALMAACDCYVSLHRAEGYGLTMAEAMSMGRPVIGTGYSGNLEFMDPDNSMLVPYEKTRIPFGNYPYPPDASWAEPDLDVAADMMRHAASDPAASAALGVRARTHIACELSLDATIGFVQSRLDDIRSNR
jgi:glycosyltransferase involved in cell wall biosynthesis